MGGHRGNRADQGTCPRPFTLPLCTELWAAVTTRVRTNKKIFLPGCPLEALGLTWRCYTLKPTRGKDYTPSHGLRPFESWFCTPLWLLPPSLSPQATQFLLPGRTWASGPLAFSSNSWAQPRSPSHQSYPGPRAQPRTCP